MGEDILFRELFSSGFEKLLQTKNRVLGKRKKKHLEMQRTFEELKTSCGSLSTAKKIKIEDASSPFPDLLLAAKSIDSVEVPAHWKDPNSVRRGRTPHIKSFSEMRCKAASFISSSLPSHSPSQLAYLFSQTLLQTPLTGFGEVFSWQFFISSFLLP
jgi:hypothetical protein